MVFSREAVKLTGDIKYFTSKSDRGTLLDRGFCPTCGNPISMLPQAIPGICLLYAPSLDDPKLYQPAHHQWTRSAQPWDKFDQSIRCYETRMA
jgi:hypothetical protein